MEFQGSVILRISDDDEAWSKANGVPIYLANAAGELIEYIPEVYPYIYYGCDQHGQIFIARTGLPKQSSVKKGCTGYHPYTYTKKTKLRDWWYRLSHLDWDAKTIYWAAEKDEYSCQLKN